MKPRPARTFQLTSALVASSVGAGVLCLAAEGLGRTFRLYATRPDASFNRRLWLRDGAVASMRVVHHGQHGAGSAWRLDGVDADLPSGAAHIISAVAPKPSLIRVDVMGPLEQRAGYHDPCNGWTDGHDAIAERLCAAFAEGDVLLVVDSPGGAAAGLQQGVAKALAAKAKHGRRVTVWANEMIGSAAKWWSAAIGDETFIPLPGQIGSIGARGEHVDVSEALAKEGVKKTYFADPPDKVALAPEFPLTPTGAARGNRDVKIAADAFRAAVCASPLGMRHKLTPEALIALGADMLTGQAAVAAGLADGVATEDEVIAYALKQAERSPSTSSSARARARGGNGTMTMREETARARAGDPPEDDDAPEIGSGIPTACGGCGVENPVAAKFCMGCGASMATKAVNAEGDEEPPPSSKPGRMPPVERMSQAASFAEIFGLPADASLPAQKAAALDARQVFAHAAKLTGQRTADTILGGLNAMAHDAANAGRLRAERDKIRREQDTAERWSLAERLVASGGAPRGKVFEDVVKADGTREEKDGKPVLKLRPVYAEMRLGTLRGEVEGYERNAAPRDPFQPDKAEAETRAADVARHGGVDKAARIERAKKDPTVLRLFGAANNTRSIDVIATAFIEAQDAAGGAS